MIAPTATALRRIAAGALLFAASHYWPTRGGATLPRPAGLEGDRSDDGLLLREAFALDLTDQPTVRGRLVSLAQSLGLADDGDLNGLEQQARTVGLDTSDPVVRRHLIELARLAASSPPPSAQADEAALRAYYAAHRADFVIPERVRLAHIYFSRAQRGDAAAADATAALATLQRDGGDAPAAADGFARGAVVGPLTRDELAREFGAPFAAAAFALPDQTWSGPLISSYGAHLVRIDVRLPATAPAFESVRGRVVHAYLRQRGEQHLQDTLAQLRTR
ncbi:MAG: peptidylprolyl isomerase [bacterium]